MAANENMRGAGLMSAAMLAFTINDAMMKAVLADVPLFQAIFLRSLGSLAALALLSRWMGPLSIPKGRADRRLLVIRSVAEVAAATLFLSALRAMPLPDATAILQTLPLAMTLAGAIWLGEPVGWRRIGAIAAGFLGVLLIVRPGAEGFGWPALLALGSVAAVVLREIATRRLSPEVTAPTAALAMAALLTAVSGLASAFQTWVAPDAGLARQLGAAVAAVAAGYVLSVGAMRAGEVAVISTFRYTGLVWSLAAGWLLSGYWPDPLSLAGAAAIAGAGLYTFALEMRLARRGGRVC